jgi:hypothetical protein
MSSTLRFPAFLPTAAALGLALLSASAHAQNSTVTGGSATGGSATGGSAVGGSVTGGTVTGGSATGGSATGGSVVGGTVTSGSATGGTATASGGSATSGAATAGKATASATVGNRQITISSTGSISIQQQGDQAQASVNGRRIVVEKERITVDGAELAKVPASASRIEIESAGNSFTVKADGREIPAAK